MSKILCDEIFGSLKIEDELLSQLEYHYGFFKTPDCIERIISLLEDEQLSDILKPIVSEYNAPAKSADESNTLREKGNQCFNMGNFEESLWLYNKSILYAPEGKTLAVAVGNRSASLFHLELYRHCITDIEFSMEIGYPSDLRPKLFMRLGRCLLNIGVYQKAIIAFRMAEKAFETVSLKQREEIDRLIETCLSKNLENESNAESLDTAIKLPQPSFGINKVLPYASENVHIVKSVKKGRSIHAKNGLKAGDVIIAEPAFALVLNQQEEPRRCHFCADSVIAVIPCSSCIDAIYCSKKCLEEAWKHHHQFECGYKIVGRLGWAPRLALRVIFRGGINLLETVFMTEEEIGLKEKCSQEEIKKESNNSSDVDERKLYLGMHGLISHLEHEDPLKRFQFVVAAVIISYFLSENTKWKSSLPEKFQERIRSRQALELLSIITLQHIAQVAANNFLIRDLWTDEDSLLKLGWRNQGSSEAPPIRVGQRQDEVASAIFITSSMLNHSCRPNSSHSYYKQYLILKAIEDIPEGKEICIHYGQEYSRASRKERRKFLRENCFFECECEACSNPDQFNSQRSRAFACPQCKGPLILNAEELEENVNSEMTCLDCLKDLNKKESFENGIDSGYYRYFKGMKALQENDVDGALWNFLECKKILMMFLFNDNISFAKVLDRIAFCYSKQEKYDKALPYISDSIGVLERTYGKESMEVAFELQKNVDVLFASMVKSKEVDDLIRSKYQLAISHIERATKILELQGGEWFHSLQDLKITKQKMDTFMNDKSHKL